MSFRILRHEKRSYSGRRAPIEAGVGGRRYPMLLFSFATDTLRWRKGERVKAELGEGTDEGRLRLVLSPEGDFALFAASSSMKRVMLRLPLPPGWPTDKRKANTPVAFAVGQDGAVLITLPDWAMTEPKAAPFPATPFRAAGESPPLCVTQKSARPRAAAPARIPAVGATSITASLMGDPPAGRSAAKIK